MFLTRAKSGINDKKICRHMSTDMNDFAFVILSLSYFFNEKAGRTRKNIAQDAISINSILFHPKKLFYYLSDDENYYSFHIKRTRNLKKRRRKLSHEGKMLTKERKMFYSISKNHNEKSH